VPQNGIIDMYTLIAARAFELKQQLPVQDPITLATYQRLVGVTWRGAHVPAICTAPGAVICVDKSQRLLRYFVNGRLTEQFDARFGDESHPTVEGVFSVYWKSRDHVSSIYHTPMPFALFFAGGEAVHYSQYFAAVGYDGHSHGCVNVRDYAGAARLFDEVAVGTRVVVYP
jgi:lipoprotein-anchoring transpeptidase ErfK/SrfK